jgi:hypothetical protein
MSAPMGAMYDCVSALYSIPEMFTSYRRCRGEAHHNSSFMWTSTGSARTYPAARC